jgi:hypothetical protein
MTRGDQIHHLVRPAAALLLLRRHEADRPLLRLGRCHQLPDCVDQPGDRLIVGGELPLQLVELEGEFLVAGDHLAQPHEGPHHVHAHFHGALGDSGRWRPGSRRAR